MAKLPGCNSTLVGDGNTKHWGWDCDGTNLIQFDEANGIPIVGPKNNPYVWAELWQEKTLNGGMPVRTSEDGFPIYEKQQMFYKRNSNEFVVAYPDYDNSGDHYHATGR